MENIHELKYNKIFTDMMIIHGIDDITKYSAVNLCDNIVYVASVCRRLQHPVSVLITTDGVHVL